MCIIPEKKVKIRIISHKNIISHEGHILSKLIDATLTLLENKLIPIVPQAPASKANGHFPILNCLAPRQVIFKVQCEPFVNSTTEES